MDSPLVSVIVPSYNHGRFIRQTIDSCLAQGYRPIEILVVDGASTDETLSVLRGYDRNPEVWWVSERDSGPVEAVNKGLGHAAGGIGLIQSSDDVCAPDAFEKAIGRFVEDPGLGLVYGDYDLVDRDGRLIRHMRLGEYSLKRLLSRRTFIPQPCAFFDLALAKRLGGWDPRFPYTPDTELWFKIALNAKVLKLDGTLGVLREHDQRRDHQGGRIVDSYRRMIAESAHIQAAPRALRRAARVGCVQLRLRYGPRTPSAQFYWAWRLLLADPTFFFEDGFPRHRLVPFYFTMAGIVGRILRMLKRAQKQ